MTADTPLLRFLKSKIDIYYHDSFFSIAKENCLRAESLYYTDHLTSLDEIEQAGGGADSAKIQVVLDQMALIEQCYIITLIFSIMTLEAFINDYGIRNTSKNISRNTFR